MTDPNRHPDEREARAIAWGAIVLVVGLLVVAIVALLLVLAVALA